MAQMGKCANPDCDNMVMHYAAPRNKRKVKEYCSPECHRKLTPAMRNFAAQWYGRQERYTVADVKAALIQALATYGGVKRLANGLIPKRPRSTIYAWMEKLGITSKDAALFRRQGTTLGQRVGGGHLKTPKWKGATEL